MHVNRPGWMTGRALESRDARRQTIVAGRDAYTTQGGTINVTQGQTPAGADATEPVDGRVRVLMLAANPASTTRLAIDEEAREITEKIRLTQDRDAFDLITRLAVRPADLLQYLNQHNPHIVHFSGHGDPAGEIMLAGVDGGDQPVGPAALAELFRIMKNKIRIVVLNACYSAVQARAIGQHIDYIVGMRARVGDQAAIIFAAAFYSALGFRRTVPQAFEQATTALMLHGLADHDVPELVVRPGADLTFRISTTG
ncbi:CHAT domain-containing protein [Dactylosporangium sp. NPDC049525]|uniref:CHAT domain-containing protein n=1 Tax=Dactylosporangium sp. NPDC049525 TaxID=3154730 RepID=UPI003438005A